MLFRGACNSLTNELMISGTLFVTNQGWGDPIPLTFSSNQHPGSLDWYYPSDSYASVIAGYFDPQAQYNDSAAADITNQWKQLTTSGTWVAGPQVVQTYYGVIVGGGFGWDTDMYFALPQVFTNPPVTITISH